MAPVETDRWSGSGSGSYSQHEFARVRENRELDRRGLRTSPFDVVSSLLLASILFTSAFVLLSFLIWLTQGTNESVVSSPPVQYGRKGSESSEGSESEFEKPLAAEIEALQEPTLQDTNETPQIYFVFTSSSPLQQFETQLLRKAGIDAKGNEIAKFISGELEARLAQIEFEYAQTNGGHDVTEIVKTMFESNRTGKVYDFRVIDQRYRAVYGEATGE